MATEPGTGMAEQGGLGVIRVSLEWFLRRSCWLPQALCVTKHDVLHSDTSNVSSGTVTPDAKIIPP